LTGKGGIKWFEVPLVLSRQVSRVGSCVPSRFKESKRVFLPDWVQDAREPFLGFEKYVYPLRSGKACLSSLLVSVSGFEPIPEPPGLLDAALEVAACTAPGVVPSWFVEEVPARSDVSDVVLGLNDDSSPGYPYCLSGLKKQGYARENFEDVVALVQCRIRLLSLVDLDSLEAMSPSDLVRRGFVDPMLVIEKNEPLKVDKFLQGKQRNIIACSVIDEIIDKLLFGPLNKNQVDRWGDISSCIGLGFTEDGIRKIFTAMLYLGLESGGKPLASSDVSGFEFCVQKWGYKGDFLRRCAALGITPDHPFARLMWARMLCVMSSVFVFTNGDVVAQSFPGWQKSGTTNTSSTNTAIRLLLAFLVGSAAARAAGDDCVEAQVPDAVQRYAALGVKIKSYDACTPDDFEFCSHRFVRGHPPEPLNALKSFYKLCCETPTFEKLKQVFTVFLHSKEMVAFATWFSRNGSLSAEND
jgi:hypothetical protein